MKSLGLELRARLEASVRTAFYASAAAVGWRISLPQPALGLEQARQAVWDAWALQVEMLARPEVRRALHRAERLDLATLPLFALSTPFDVLRVLRKRVLGTPRLRVRPTDGFSYPNYYLNDFHHQANGNLSMRAAVAYEWQVRFLFFGASRLMRQAVIDELPRGDELEILDVGCGTAAWIGQARSQERDHWITGVDLSPQYLWLARQLQRRNTSFVQANAEALPEHWAGRFDTVVSIWLFHELPLAAVRAVIAQIARVLKPGGRLLFLDAAQPQDLPGPRAPIEQMANHFHDVFNEPYFKLFQRLDLDRLFADHGLSVVRSRRCFASQLRVAVKGD